MSCKTSEILVAAIDFGTTYSGWAYNFLYNHERDPTQAFTKPSYRVNKESTKFPTTVLIKQTENMYELIALGYEAEDMYAYYAEKQEHQKYYYFRRFKMILMDKIGLKRNITIEDETGKQLSAKLVFSMAIKHIRDDLLNDCSQHIFGVVQSEEIMWVLTVPAIWNDSARQFMREAAVKAGINTNKLTIALEPETASLFCRHLPIDRMVGKVGLSAMTEGSKYMIIDAGGGTVDITVHQILKEGKLKEVHKASGGAWGGIKVDEKYEQFLISIVGSHVFKTFVKMNMEDYIEILREFEIRKRKVMPLSETKKQDAGSKINIRFPLSLKEILEKETGKDIVEAIRHTEFSGLIQLSKDKLRVDAEVFRSFFAEAIQSIVDHVKNLFSQPAMKDVSQIIMVGGFSESMMLQDAIKINFPAQKIVTPLEASLAVLRGAVVFGHTTGTLIERIAKYTYGISSLKPFVEGEDDEERMIVDANGVKYRGDLFYKYAEVGQILKSGDIQFDGFKPMDATETRIGISLFTSSEKNPKYVSNKSCSKIGEMTLNVNNTVPFDKREFTISLNIGDTEIHVKAVEKSTGMETTCSLDFLNNTE